MKKIIESIRLKRIKLLALDVDGVLTNGKINIDAQGNEIKVFDVQDGFGIVLLRQSGLKTAIISARAAPAVIARATDLGIDRVYQDAHPKTDALEQLLKEFKLKYANVCFIGDDLPDICVLRKVGFAVAVSNAAPQVKKHAHYVTTRAGGDGAVREVIELIMNSQNKWKKVVKAYKG